MKGSGERGIERRNVWIEAPVAAQASGERTNVVRQKGGGGGFDVTIRYDKLKK